MTTDKTDTPILDVRNLEVAFETPHGIVQAVNNVSFTLQAGQCLGVVGESGSGKTQTFMAAMGVKPNNAIITGQALFKGQDMLAMTRKEQNKIRGARIAFIMQDSLLALTPHMQIGDQLTEILRSHLGLSGKEAEARALECLERVRIPEARRRLRMYPHEFSGGMRQRVTIGMALLCDPDILIADEPTTALDVTLQAQVMDIFDELQRESNMAIVLITHDLAVLAGRADEVMVMYGGRIVEKASVSAFFEHQFHPYSEGLLSAIPHIDSPTDKDLTVIPGQPPDLMALPKGCAFAPRCILAKQMCVQTLPELEVRKDGRSIACHLPVTS